MFEFMRRVRPAAAAVFVSLFLVACGDDDDPVREEFTPESASELAAVADEIVDAGVEALQLQANLFNAFGVLGGGSIALAEATPFAVLEQMRAPASVATFRGFAPALSQMGPSGLLLPEELEGVTFVWSFENESYVASEETGAPANGARFIIYSVDPETGVPTEPLTPTGHLDLVDESTEDVARLEISVIDSDDEAAADFFLQGSVDTTGTESTVTLDSEGFIRGTDRLEFDMRMVFSSDELEESSEMHTTVELETNDGSISLDHDEVISATYESVATFVISGAGNEAEFSFTSEGESEEVAMVDGVLAFNGEDVVVFSGDADDPDFSTPDGDELGAQEIQAVAIMWGAFAQTYIFTLVHLFSFLLLMSVSGF